jgi:cob(I)alamin adenosyltransferase
VVRLSLRRTRLIYDGMSPRRKDEPVRLTRIYTRGGDRGETSLGDGSRTSKLDPRIVAFGTVDELNAHLGVALAGGLPERARALLTRVQNELFDVGADLSTPVVADPAYPPLRVLPDYVTRLEQACDHYNADLTALRSFILPGGTPAAAQLHVCRTVARRAERAGWAAYAEHGDTMNVVALTYLNRLSDLLFILARHANRGQGDLLWAPGGER